MIDHTHNDGISYTTVAAIAFDTATTGRAISAVDASGDVEFKDAKGNSTTFYAIQGVIYPIGGKAFQIVEAGSTPTELVVFA